MVLVPLRRPVATAALVIALGSWFRCPKPPIEPGSSPVPSLFVFAPAEIAPGESAVGTVTLTSAPAAAVSVALVCAGAPQGSITYPASLRIEAGQRTGTFTLATTLATAVINGVRVVDCGATTGSVTLRASVVVRTTASPSEPLQVETIAVFPDDVFAGDDFECLVRLTRPFAQGDGLVGVLAFPVYTAGNTYGTETTLNFRLGERERRFRLPAPSFPPDATTAALDARVQVQILSSEPDDSGRPRPIHTLLKVFTLLARTQLTSIAPAEGAPGSSVPVLVSGRFRHGFEQLSASGGGVTITDEAIAANDARQLNARVVIGATAVPGARTIASTDPRGVPGALSFTVLPLGTPTLTSLSPASLPVNGTSGVILTGTNFTGGATVGLSGTGVSVTGVTVLSATRIGAQFTVPVSSSPGVRDVTVTTPGGSSNSLPFTVTSPAPTIASISPASGDVGFNVEVTITGTNFTGGSTVAISGGDVTVAFVSVVDATTITATFQIGQFAAGGARNVTVTTADGTSNAVTFTIIP